MDFSMPFWTIQNKESGSFSEEKEPKRLLLIWAMGVGNSRLQSSESFCTTRGARRLFFQKKRLSYLPT
jgi:hypothetical protein